MASTYSTNLRIELIGTGDQSGTWGNTTNTNLGTLIEEAIAGYVTQTVTDGAATVLTIPNGASSNGRNYVIALTGTLTAARTVEVPAVDKPYIFFNNTTGGYAVTVKVSGQTGVTIANGKKAIVYTNSTDVIEVVNAPVSEAGTQTLTNKTLTSPTINTPTLSAPVLGTPSSGTLTNCSGLPLTTGVTGTLPVANGGTGSSSLTANNVLLGNGTSAVQVVAPGTNGNILTSNGTTWVSQAAASSGFPSGTAMLFVQTSAPTGWTKSTTHDNKALRIVSGAASSGGSVAFTTAFASQTPSGSVSLSGTVGATTLSTAQIPSHSHSSVVAASRYDQTYAGGDSYVSSGNTGNAGGGGSHDHSFSGSGSFSGNAINLAVQYVDAIIATKD